MSFGISTSCLYPLITEEALATLGQSGVKICEVFLNSLSETTPEFADKLNTIKNEYGIKISSVHPFSSFAETFMLFSEYERRFFDALEFYKRCAEIASLLEAKFLVIHGSRLPAKISNETYFERFQRLVDTGKDFGITVCQENVHSHFSENPVFLKEMRSALNKNFKMVFDIKQAVRSGFSPLEFAEEFKNEIVHIHLSDHKKGCDCLPPAQGIFDFKKLFNIMDSAGYKGDYVIELYRNNFDEPSDLIKALEYVQNL